MKRAVDYGRSVSAVVNRSVSDAEVATEHAHDPRVKMVVFVSIVV
jgi:hypothetical protein